jgi:hypothetical protein
MHVEASSLDAGLYLVAQLLFWYVARPVIIKRKEARKCRKQ